MLSKIGIAVFAGAALAASAPAQAQAAAGNAASTTQPSTAVQPPVEADAPVALSDSALDALRGGESMVVTNQTLVAITSGNVINGDYAAGNVSISDNALSNFNGLGNLLINTGAQVSLQTGMNVTININQ
jgi:hypothetical protein